MRQGFFNLISVFKSKLFSLPNFYYYIAIVLLIGVGVFLCVDISYAAGGDKGFTDYILDGFNILLYYFASAIGYVAMKFFAVIIAISSYNNFMEVPAVNNAWFLVRDSTNMFFVLVMLVIAFGRILGIESYGNTKMLANVLLAAILVNFSKLICGLFIDFAQVVMMTFVVGYQASATGNLVEGLGLTEFFSVSPGDNTLKSPSAWEMTVTLVLATVLLLITLFIIFAILVLLSLRIVMIWILIVLSPLAFVLNILPVTKSYASEWWKKFGWTVSIGPILAFFLWMSLTFMSQPGNLVPGYDSKIDKYESTANKPSISYLDKLATFIISASMLGASLMVAQKGGGLIGSVAGKFSQKGMSMAKSAGKIAARPVTNRASAVKQGFSERSAAKKELKMAKWKDRGAGVSQLKDKSLAAAKKAIPGGIAGVAGAFKITEAGREAGGGFAGMKASAKREWTSGDFGRMDQVAGNMTKNVRMQESKKQGETLLKNSGIDPNNKDEVRGYMNDNSGDKGIAAAGFKQLANLGGLDAKDMQEAKKVFKGDAEGEDSFKSIVDKNQKELNYVDSEGKIDESKVQKDINSGKLTEKDIQLRHVRADDESAEKKYAQSIMNNLLDSKGEKSFGKSARKAEPEKQDMMVAAMVSAIKSAKEDKTEEENKDKIPARGIPEGKEKSDFRDDKKIKDLDEKIRNIPVQLAKTNGDMSGLKGDDKELGKYIKGAGESDLGKMKLSGEGYDFTNNVAANITIKQLEKMADSADGGTIENLEKILQSGALGDKIGDVVNNQKIMSAINANDKSELIKQNSGDDSSTATQNVNVNQGSTVVTPAASSNRPSSRGKTQVLSSEQKQALEAIKNDISSKMEKVQNKISGMESFQERGTSISNGRSWNDADAAQLEKLKQSVENLKNEEKDRMNEVMNK